MIIFHRNNAGKIIFSEELSNTQRIHNNPFHAMFFFLISSEVTALRAGFC